MKTKTKKSSLLDLKKQSISALTTAQQTQVIGGNTVPLGGPVITSRKSGSIWH